MRRRKKKQKLNVYFFLPNPQSTLEPQPLFVYKAQSHWIPTYSMWECIFFFVCPFDSLLTVHDSLPIGHYVVRGNL